MKSFRVGYRWKGDESWETLTIQAEDYDDAVFMAEAILMESHENIKIKLTRVSREAIAA